MAAAKSRRPRRSELLPRGTFSTEPREDKTMIQDDLTDNTVGRRGLILGAGAAALVAGATLTQPAAAEPKIAPGQEVRTNAQADGSPITTTIASPPVSGYIYRTVCMFDFEPFFPSAQRTWGGSGPTPQAPLDRCGPRSRSRRGHWSGTWSTTSTTTPAATCFLTLTSTSPAPERSAASTPALPFPAVPPRPRPGSSSPRPTTGRIPMAPD